MGNQDGEWGRKNTRREQKIVRGRYACALKNPEWWASLRHVGCTYQSISVLPAISDELPPPTPNLGEATEGRRGSYLLLHDPTPANSHMITNCSVEDITSVRSSVLTQLPRAWLTGGTKGQTEEGPRPAPLSPGAPCISTFYEAFLGKVVCL